MVSVTDLKDYTLCKAIPWIRNKLGWREPITNSQKIARGVNLKDVVSDLPEPKYYEVHLRDKDSGLNGIVDVLTEDSVIEVKAFHRRFYEHFRIQLLAYAYLAEKNGFRIRNSILMMNKEKKLNIEIRKEHIEYIGTVVNKLAESLEDDSPPIVNPSPILCKACQYRLVCPVSVLL
ncbi:CRISPR-associated protein Cas4 [Acidianus sulfidivorans JP7]|uniref:CRISPR-associated exonuclease Cas4 n=1 Tax=Acidianus sulfidivorans JP7 TaxID=619593 RepID=A0A2U9IPZ9_9CREN|nr:CRISPR-associated protein Cas4 [Acidianus sulfidivorans]AWR98100.1 CRISPR-associated protein Cas4 [Acidianus sulfidivorans JP7]